MKSIQDCLMEMVVKYRNRNLAIIAQELPGFSEDQEWNRILQLKSHRLRKVFTLMSGLFFVSILSALFLTSRISIWLGFAALVFLLGIIVAGLVRPIVRCPKCGNVSGRKRIHCEYDDTLLYVCENCKKYADSDIKYGG